MDTIIVYLCSSMCLFIYIPVVWMGIKQIISQNATLDVKMRRYLFTGPSAVLFGVSQALGGVVAIAGVMLAVQNYNLLYIPLFVALGAGLSMGGFTLAQRMVHEDNVVDLTPRIDLGSFFMWNVGFQQVNDPQDDFVSVEDEDIITLSPDDVTVIDDDDIKSSNL
jgi:drug/metabolite transporter (DMT)-like permease